MSRFFDIRSIRELLEIGNFSFEILDSRLSKGMKNRVLIALTEKSRTLKLKWKIGTSEWYLYTKKSIENLIKDETAKKNITPKDLKFSNVTVDWLGRYENYPYGVRSNRRGTEKEPLHKMPKTPANYELYPASNFNFAC